jgi:hypothetical protein
VIFAANADTRDKLALRLLLDYGLRPGFTMTHVSSADKIAVWDTRKKEGPPKRALPRNGSPSCDYLVVRMICSDKKVAQPHIHRLTV